VRGILARTESLPLLNPRVAQMWSTAGEPGREVVLNLELDEFDHWDKGVRAQEACVVAVVCVPVQARSISCRMLSLCVSGESGPQTLSNRVV